MKRWSLQDKTSPLSRLVALAERYLNHETAAAIERLHETLRLSREAI
jgi:hypothetical protein